MTHKLPFHLSNPVAHGEPVREIRTARLLLDPENPRLQLKDGASQDTIIRLLYDDHRLEELMHSLIANGYFDEEPLVAVPHKSKKEHYVVVEGNRRLAALKLLTEPDLAAKLKIFGLPDGTPDEIDRLRNVPVKVYAKRHDVLPYLGFRHITGVKEWDSASKARYIYQLKHSTSYTLTDIAQMIGDTYNLTERLYLGWSLLVQSEGELGVDRNDFYKFPFSYMYDAVRMPEIREFLGLSRDGDYRVAKRKHTELRELLEWLFGSQVQHRRPIVDRKSQLKQLAYAVADKDGLSSLRRGLSLEDAYQATVGERDQLLTWLTRAGRDLDSAKGVIHRHKESSEVRELVQKCADTMTRLSQETRL